MMPNTQEIIRTLPTAQVFDIEGLLFAQFQCPQQENEVCLWTEVDHLFYVLSGRSSWRTSSGILSAEAGESVFFKKGAYSMPEHFVEDLCLEIFFIPDVFVRETVMQLARDLPPPSQSVDILEPAIRVTNDATLAAFFQAMTIYFESGKKPPEALLKLKLKELLTSILMGSSNPALSAYFRSIAASDSPPLSAIMESNFKYNLPLETFAQICHRSVSSFKRDFRKYYGTSPGKWLLQRRLQHSASLLQQTSMPVTEIAFQCGFEDLSHFSKAFKGKFGSTPSAYREKFSAQF